MSGARIAYVDGATGVSGDKLLGALLDIGMASGEFTPNHLQELLNELGAEGHVVAERVFSHGIGAVHVRIEAEGPTPHRRWRDLRATFEGSSLPEPVRADAIRVFSALAEAEGHVHGHAADEVHFHEVGALDSILDVTGVCAGLHALGIGRLLSSPLATGSGTVTCEHGVLPVPAPATARLLLGVPVTPGPGLPGGGAPGELTTPTGAALLVTLGDGFGACPPLTPAAIGYGAGTRDIGAPNVCRVTLGEPAAAPVELAEERVAVLETNIDHLSPEAAAETLARLLAEGALDAWTSPIVMKKGRPSYTLSVLVTAADAKGFAGRVVALTGSLGVRVTEVGRLVAAREVRTIDTPYGPVRVKAAPAGVSHRLRPEADDVARVARERGVPFAEAERDLAEIAAAQWRV